jgi:hypothetical protein
LQAELATFTSGTATNWFVSNLSSQNSSSTNLFAGNATFSYATVTNGFFTNLSVTGPVSAALNNGYVFRGGTNNFSEATSTLFVADSSKIGIGSTTPSEKLSVQGNLLVSGDIVTPKISGMTDSSVSDVILCVDGSGNITKDGLGSCYGTASSDERLKKNISTISNVLDKVKTLKTVNFEWIDEKRGTTTQLGYIAQDVEKVFPEMVKIDNKGYLKVNYLSLSAIYANAIKELDEKVFSKIDELVKRLMGNESKILELESRVKTLEERLNIQTTPVTNNAVTPLSQEGSFPTNSTSPATSSETTTANTVTETSETQQNTGNISNNATNSTNSASADTPVTGEVSQSGADTMAQ